MHALSRCHCGESAMCHPKPAKPGTIKNYTTKLHKQQTTNNKAISYRKIKKPEFVRFNCFQLESTQTAMSTMKGKHKKEYRKSACLGYTPLAQKGHTMLKV